MQLTDDELRRYQAYVARHGAFQYVLQDPSDGDLSLTLRFYGEGDRAPTTIEKEAIMFWAQTVFERLLGQEQRDTAVATARLALARDLAVDAEAIEVVGVEEVTWPDACLGLEQPGVFCAQLSTRGFRIDLAAGGETYAYRADRAGLVRAVIPQAQPTLAVLTPTPPPASTPTRLPTTVPTATATAWPTPAATPTRAPAPTGYWRGEYFANDQLLGYPLLVRRDDAIDMNWGYNAPAYGLPAEHFSVRWSRLVAFSEGNYNWKVRADDGVRLYIDGVLILDQWHGGYTDDVVRRWMGAGNHEIVVEYFELEGIASARMTWEKLYAPKTPTPSPTPTVLITEWRGEYFDNANLTGAPKLVRNDARLDFDWGKGSPDIALPQGSLLRPLDAHALTWPRGRTALTCALTMARACGSMVS